MAMRPQESNIWASKNDDKILDFIQKRLTYLLSLAEPLPPYDIYLKTLRNDIWDKYKHHPVEELQDLIKNGFQER